MPLSAASDMKRVVDLSVFERALAGRGYLRICGVDEAGRGPLAGPVVAAAVVLPYPCPIAGINDSKQLSESRREALYDEITQAALGIGIGIVDHDIIDRINILQATKRAMREAVAQVSPPPDHLLIDALTLPDLPIPQKGIAHGDALSISIAAASIIAKVTRDQQMRTYHDQWPQYDFARHKGYGTQAHLDAIRRYGPSPIHRMTFRGVK